MAQKSLRIVDIPPETLEKTGKRISDYTVGFAKLTASGEPDASLGGSGTLVKIDHFHAVLTAAHVVDLLWKSDQFGLVLSGSPSGPPHNLSFEKSLVKEVRVPRSSGLDIGEPPDISLPILPDSRLGDISAHKSFYDLLKHRDDSLFESPDWSMGFWTIAGFADEWTAARPPILGFKRFIEFNGKIIPGFATPVQTASEFDAWEFSVKRDQDYDGPSSFEGYSGGGLWQNLVGTTKKTSQVHITKSLLSGVAYHQSGFQKDSNTIRCNGRRCIYEHLMNVLKV